MLSEKLTEDRGGNFTASENHRLMAGWDKPAPEIGDVNIYSAIKEMGRKPLVGGLKEILDCEVTGALINQAWAAIQYEKPPQGLITYAEEKAIESFYSFDPSLNFSTVHTINGEEREVECMELLAKATGLKFINIGDEQVHISANGVGATPDGVVIDDLDLVETGAEVKCKSPLEHAKNMMIRNNDDLKNQAFDHFVQIQTCMLVTGASHWYFANFNPYAKHDSLKFGFIIIQRDNDFIEVLQSRIDMAHKIKNSFLTKLKESLSIKE